MVLFIKLMINPICNYIGFTSNPKSCTANDWNWRIQISSQWRLRKSYPITHTLFVRDFAAIIIIVTLCTQRYNYDYYADFFRSLHAINFLQLIQTSQQTITFSRLSILLFIRLSTLELLHTNRNNDRPELLFIAGQQFT